MISKLSKIFVAGHRGLAGSAIVRSLTKKGYSNILVVSRQELDLLEQAAVFDFLDKERPEYIFIAAAKVGGIYANHMLQADFITQNLSIANNLIYGAHRSNVPRLMFLGSSCVYPRDCAQPIKESYLLSGSLELSNEMYAVAKIAGIKLCEAFSKQYGRLYMSVMPSNLYGLNDNYHPEFSHVLPALIHKCHLAKIRGDSSITLWGSGEPLREFLFSEDFADACTFLMEQDDIPSIVNIGSGRDIRIYDLARIVMNVIGCNTKIAFDESMPSGTPRKLLDSSVIKSLGWRPSTSLYDGIQAAYRDYVNRLNKIGLVKK
jgi:GDP-L-fucose synthase